MGSEGVKTPHVFPGIGVFGDQLTEVQRKACYAVDLWFPSCVGLLPVHFVLRMVMEVQPPPRTSSRTDLPWGPGLRQEGIGSRIHGNPSV